MNKKLGSIILFTLFLMPFAVGCDMRSNETIAREKAGELGKFSPPVKLDPKAAIKGKVAIVEQTYAHMSFGWRSHSANGSVSIDIADYGLSKDRVTNKPDEIDTLIQVVCRSGGKGGGAYTTNTGKTVTVSGKECKVSIIDYKMPAIVAQKTIANEEQPGDTIMVREGESSYDLGNPYEAVKRYIRDFPKE